MCKKKCQSFSHNESWMEGETQASQKLTETFPGPIMLYFKCKFLLRGNMNSRDYTSQSGWKVFRKHAKIMLTLNYVIALWKWFHLDLIFVVIGSNYRGKLTESEWRLPSVSKSNVYWMFSFLLTYMWTKCTLNMFFKPIRSPRINPRVKASPYWPIVHP